jgi:hypothetical protein
MTPEEEYQALRESIKAQGFDETDVDDLLLEALVSFKIANVDVEGDPLTRISAHTKIRALKKLL